MTSFKTNQILTCCGFSDVENLDVVAGVVTADGHHERGVLAGVEAVDHSNLDALFLQGKILL